MLRNSLIFCLLANTALAGDPNFSARTLPDHAYTGGWEHFVGGGVAAFDCNGAQNYMRLAGQIRHD